MNGNFNSEAGSGLTYSKTPGWTNLAGDQFQVASNSNVTYDGSQNLMVTSSRVSGLNTGYEMVEGDVFDLSYVWADNWNWVDGSDKISISLFTTADDTITGLRTDLITDLSPLSTQNDSYENVISNSIYTATAADAGKVIFVAITGTSTGFARLDNFELLRHSAIASNQIPVFNENPINRANGTVNSAYSGSIASSASDADGDLLTYSLITAPDWLVLTSDGTLSGTPTSAGQFSWSVEVSDGTDTVTETLNITVDAASTGPTILFSDDFESGNANAWTISGSAIVNGTSAYNGSYGTLIKKAAIIERVVSTVGYSNITLSYARRTLALSGAENLRSRWKVEGTSTWYDLETLNTTGYATHSKILPAAAENTSIIIRFVTNSNKNNEKAYLDDILVIGE